MRRPTISTIDPQRNPLHNIPKNTIAFKVPLSCKLRWRAFWATGNIYGTEVDSNNRQKVDGIAVRKRKKLKIPSPHVEIASSKSATLSKI